MYSMGTVVELEPVGAGTFWSEPEPGAGAGAAAGEKTNPEPVKNGPAPQH